MRLPQPGGRPAAEGEGEMTTNSRRILSTSIAACVVIGLTAAPDAGVRLSARGQTQGQGQTQSQGQTQTGGQRGNAPGPGGSAGGAGGFMSAPGDPAKLLFHENKTADAKYYASEEGSGETTAWIETDYILSNLHWRDLLMTDTPTNASNRRPPNPKRVPIIPTAKGTPDLSKVEEAGFSDLMEGGWIPATTRVNFFELWGKAVPRKP